MTFRAKYERGFSRNGSHHFESENLISAHWTETRIGVYVVFPFTRFNQHNLKPVERRTAPEFTIAVSVQPV